MSDNISEALVIDYTVHRAADDAAESTNLSVERLDSDPELTDVGRVWFNVTENRLKVSVFAADGSTFVARNMASTEDIQDLLSLLITVLQQAKNSIM